MAWSAARVAGGESPDRYCTMSHWRRWPSKRRLLHRRDRCPAIARAFPAHLGAQLAVLMIVARAFLATDFADARAKLERRAQRLDILAGAPHRYLAGGRADIGAIQTRPDALPH